jgi:hypothetical protein
MHVLRTVCCLICLSLTGLAQGPVRFDEFFEEAALRVDFYQTGDAGEEVITLDRMHREAVWPESRTRLLDPFNNGRYAVSVYDTTSQRLVYSRGFDTMFGEYRTTDPALRGVQRTFNRAVRVPFPKHPVKVNIEVRDRQNILRPLFSVIVDPRDFHIQKESGKSADGIYRFLQNGDPEHSVDIVFLGEGYTIEDTAKFRSDVARMSAALFAVEPYKSRQGAFSLHGVLRPSAERGMDEPRSGSFKATALNASFDTFDLDRYMLTEEGRALRVMAAQVPYDAIVILVNSPRYGGGGIYNDYCITTVDHPASPGVFVHEFGHSFAGLADEYYSADVAYKDFYPKGVDPLEPNITALLDPARIKWQDQLSPGVALPTEWGKETLDSLQAERRSNGASRSRTLKEAEGKNLDGAERVAIESRFKENDRALQTEIEGVRKRYAHLEETVGAFEGAGYTSRGMYRSMMYCLMIHHPKNEFCRVCRQAISRMIDYQGAR